MQHYRGDDVRSASALWLHALAGHLFNMARPESIMWWRSDLCFWGCCFNAHCVWKSTVILQLMHSIHIFCMLVTLMILHALYTKINQIKINKGYTTLSFHLKKRRTKRNRYRWNDLLPFKTYPDIGGIKQYTNSFLLTSGLHA